MPITEENLNRFRQQTLMHPTAALAMNAVAENGVLKSAIDLNARRKNVHEYSLNLKTGAVTDQKRSGRCWMFAAHNAMRFEVMKRLNLENFGFSPVFPLFYDKLEKSGYFLDNILETLEEETGSRILDFLLKNPLGDGGQFDMFAGLLEKYGAVPEYAMPETACSQDTGAMDKYLTLKLREYACVLRRAYREGEKPAALRARREEMLSTLYRMLCICLGFPPERVDMLARDKENRLIRDEGLSPRDFFQKYVGWNLRDHVSLINAPTADKPYGRAYTVRFLGSVAEARPVRYLNLPVEELKDAAIRQLQAGEPVWFGSDVGQSMIREGGILDTASVRADLLFDTPFPLTKAERLDYGESLMTHAMVLLGVHLDGEDRPVRWRVENSWGKESGAEGYYLMTDAWFSEYVYQVVIRRKYLSEAQLAGYDGEVTVLEPWDPMGSLA